MTKKKVYKKDKLITSIDELLRNKYKPFIITYPKEAHVFYDKIKIMALTSVVSLIENKNLYLAVVIEVDVVRKTKTKEPIRKESNISGCKTSISDIYGE